ncbi:DUF6328 family protein [Catenulispora yoronensis]|uniref:DUF6328 family protein n=1 Tax=Catenulispora yoronensis TaxID=450799 RepID=A0ABP5FWY0_9ACTN
MDTHSGEHDRSTRDETPAERADRNLTELLQELRVLQTGVQIIFAFLLGVAFTPRFTQLTTLQENVYIAALLLSVSSVAVLVAPVAIHRQLFHHRQKQRIVKLSTRLARAGLVLVAAALDCSVFLILDVIRGHAAASVVAAAVAVMFGTLWFVFPWTLRRS